MLMNLKGPDRHRRFRGTALGAGELNRFPEPDGSFEPSLEPKI